MVKRTVVVFVLLGLVSLTADMVYEGARSVGGAYVEGLGGPPLASAIVGAGDLLGYVFRFVSAVVASYLTSSFAFWGVVFLGYAVQMVAMPSLAFAGSWEVAAFLYLAERAGRGLRTPLRDVVVAEVSEDIGRGKGFGIHELLDQLGAIVGPVLVAAMLGLYGYKAAFLSLAVPGAVSLGLVVAVMALYPRVKSVELSFGKVSFRGLGRRFYVYIVASVLLSLGFVHWMNVSYFLKYWGLLGDAEIALAYMVAMFADATVAVPVGVLYDRLGLKTLYIAPLSALGSSLLLVYAPSLSGLGGLGVRTLVYTMAALWGVTMGCFETIMRASIADILPPEKRAMGYGVYGLVYGVSWTIGSLIYALLLAQLQTVAAIYAFATLILSAFLVSKI
uniref:MFS transporter n=1 Tax=Thermofilum adornatum TaxID=1365176 RepID=A0A7C1CEU8_9CREN